MAENLNAISCLALLTSSLALWFATRLNAYQSHEYQFYLEEHREKLGAEPSLWAKIVAWNAALGGRSPKWHWIEPVVSPASTYHR